MSDRYDNSRRRGVLTHWVPLVLTLTIATAGVAAWAWSQRNRDDDYEDDENEHGFMSGGNGPGPNYPGSGRPNNQQRPYSDLDYNNADYGDNPPYGASTPQPPPAGSTVGNTINMADTTGPYPGPPGGGWGARMSDVIRTGSPQHWVGNASKAVTAGISAASAAVGGALASIREGDKDAYADHETWSEEADARHERRDRPSAPSVAASGAVAAAATAAAASSVAAPFSKDVVGRKRKTVAIVVSADHDLDVDEDGFHEHAVS